MGSLRSLGVDKGARNEGAMGAALNITPSEDFFG